MKTEIGKRYILKNKHNNHYYSDLYGFCFQKLRAKLFKTKGSAIGIVSPEFWYENKIYSSTGKQKKSEINKRKRLLKPVFDKWFDENYMVEEVTLNY